MFKFRNLSVAAVVMSCAVSAMASNFRVADQVYVPVAGHVVGGSGTFISDVNVSNLSTDSVSVSVTYAAQGNTAAQQVFSNLFTLAPGERREFVDFVATPQAQGGLGLGNGFGMLLFNGCKANTSCGTDTQNPFGVSENFRPISVESRIYSIPPGTTLANNPPTTGQLFSGLPWYSYVSSDTASVGLDKVFITGIRQTGSTGTAGTYRTNIGLVNASQFGNTTIVVKLFNGATGAQSGSTYTLNLGPFGQVQQPITNMFPGFTGSNAYVTVEQTNNSSAGLPNTPTGCQTNGCPGFFAYGSLLDNASGDATTLESQFLKALSDEALTCIYAPTGNCKSANALRRIAKH
jgi:hypothetical protein